MKKIINGQIIDTEAGGIVATRTSHQSHSNDPIGWETITLIDGVYYLETSGGNDIYAPEDDLEEIGAGCRDSLLPFAERDEWSKSTKLIEHIERSLS